jgi:hypothetical protein
VASEKTFAITPVTVLQKSPSVAAEKTFNM